GRALQVEVEVVDPGVGSGEADHVHVGNGATTANVDDGVGAAGRADGNGLGYVAAGVGVAGLRAGGVGGGRRQGIGGGGAGGGGGGRGGGRRGADVAAREGGGGHPGRPASGGLVAGVFANIPEADTVGINCHAGVVTPTARGGVVGGVVGFTGVDEGFVL